MKGYFVGRVMAVVMLGFGWAQAADWPQYGGPDRNNVSSEKGLARKWPEAGPKVLWTVNLGPGYASPSIAGGRVYILDRPDDVHDVLRCLDIKDGKDIWNVTYEAPGSVSHNGSRTAPTVDGQYVYSVGLLGHFYCVDLATNRPVWHKNICADFGLEVPRWGVTQAPSLYKDLVIVAPQAPEAFVAAYRRNTGELVWKSPSLGLVGYVTPVIAALDGVEQAVMVGAGSKDEAVKGAVAGISLEDGSILWRYEGWQCFIPIPYPVILPDDRLFITGGYRAGSAMIQVKKQDGAFAVKELFKTDVCGSQIQQPILFDEHLYLNSNSNEREDGMMCLTLDGQMKWKTKDIAGAPTFERGPLLMADNLIFNLDGKRGILYLVEPSPVGYKELAKVQLLGGKEIWAPMALSDGKLLVRSQSEMKCLDVGKPN